MKAFFQFLMIVFLSFAMVCCYSAEEPIGPDMPIVGDITLSQEQMTISAAGGEFSVNITAEYDYKAISNIDWVEVTRISYSANYSTLYFSVAQNDTTSSRAGVLTIFCDDYNLSAKLNILQKTREQIPNNEIWYTSSNRAVVVPSLADGFGANIISNTYNDGKGVITFDGDVPYIGFEAFRECTNLKSIVIPNSATIIGQYAFCRCTSLTSATLPDGVTTIGYGAFYECVGLKSVVIPGSVTCIAYRAFQFTSLGNITIPNSVTEIGDYAFGGCSSLTSITIPSSITSIGEGSFASCGRLSSIIIPDSVTSIGDAAFRNCTSLTSVTIGNSVTSIGYEAFHNCTSLINVTIPNSVTLICEGAFASCGSLTSVTIPDNVTKIQSYAFGFCESLRGFYGKFASSDNRCLIVDGVLNSFAPAGQFVYKIPSGVTEIGYRAFSSCGRLSNIIIPDSVTKIREEAFHNCSSLTSVAIPDSVTSIGGRAFKGCTSLKEVYCKPIAPPIGGYYMFEGNASERKIYVPTASVEAYKSADDWKDYADYIEGYDF